MDGAVVLFLDLIFAMMEEDVTLKVVHVIKLLPTYMAWVDIVLHELFI